MLTFLLVSVSLAEVYQVTGYISNTIFLTIDPTEDWSKNQGKEIMITVWVGELQL